MLHAPGIPVFMDGRANTLYDDPFYDEYLHAYAGRPGVRSILWKRGVDAVLVPPGSGIARALAKGREPWSVVYADPVALLLLPPAKGVSRPELPNPEHVLAGTPELWVLRGNRALRSRKLTEAEIAFERAMELNPLLGSAQAGLSTVAARRNDAPALERWARRAIEVYPRERRRIYFRSSAAYGQMGDLEAALEAAKRAMPRGPFTSSAGVKRRIQRLQARIQQASTQGGEK
jgi:tetratricopeptide (TPR) repeat protein